MEKKMESEMEIGILYGIIGVMMFFSNGFKVGYCPHPVTVDIRGPIKDYICDI